MPDNAVERPAYAEEFRRFRSQGPRAFRCHILLGPSATQEDVFEDADVSRRERQEWRAREEDLQRQVSEVQQQNETMKRELDVFREQAGLCEEKNVQLERLRAQLEAERHIALEREENHIADRKRLQAEFEKDREEAAAREAELMFMLHEVQDSIITAGVDATSEDEAMA